MTTPETELPDDVHFGGPDEPLPEWRDALAGDDDPDDEVLKPTPPDVIAVLGFDPAEFADEE